MLVIDRVLLGWVHLSMGADLALAQVPIMWLCCLDMWGLVAMVGLKSVITVEAVMIAVTLTVCQSAMSAVGLSNSGVGATISAVHAGRTDMQSKILFQISNSYNVSRNIRAFLRSVSLEYKYF